MTSHPSSAPAAGTGAGAGSTSGTQHLITQAYFDDVLAENADLFDIDTTATEGQEQALSETIDQLSSQGMALDHLCVEFHPNSEEGRAVRERRGELETALATLDGLVQGDGGIREFENEQEVDGVLAALRAVASACSGGDGSGGDGTGRGSIGAYPALALFKSTESIFTLMSLLGIVPLPTSTTGTLDGNDCADISNDREKILKATCQTLSSILSPPSASSIRFSNGGSCDRPELVKKIRAIKAEIRDSFVAFDRLVGLIDLYTLAATKGMDQAHGILTDLANLATAACGGCEKNKVTFVRAGKEKVGGGSCGIESPASTAEITPGRDSSGGISAVVSVLSLPVTTMDTSSAAGTKMLASYCKLLAVLCRFDDFRNPPSNEGGGVGGMPSPDIAVSSAHDHVLEFNRNGIIPVLHEVTRFALNEVGGNEGGSSGHTSSTTSLELAAAALSATRTLAVNDEIVQALVAVGGLKSARIALVAGVGVGEGAGGAEESKMQQGQLRALTSSSLGLIRNLCGNDEIKTNLCLGTADNNDETSTVLPTIILAMRRYRSDPVVQEHGCATLAAMALRKPANAKKIIDEGGPMEVLTAMRQLPNVVPLQRQGALAVRNISSRLIKMAEAEQSGKVDTSISVGGGTEAIPSVEARDTFLDLGAESVLRDIAGKHQGSVDEAYAALRDLGCQVSMVRYDAESTHASGSRGVRGVAMFGESKARFNPVFEESDALEEAVERL
mmetsp:Transcript_35244/g.77188  ORF Transcript_35244/g.77188 Transcript_35244/m.77188 type:complete len:731 (-) Transcript_35244:78-2270(-)